MKTISRKNGGNVALAKRASKNLRDLRKRGGNISLFKATGEPKASFNSMSARDRKEGWDDRSSEAWDLTHANYN